MSEASKNRSQKVRSWQIDKASYVKRKMAKAKQLEGAAVSAAITRMTGDDNHFGIDREELKKNQISDWTKAFKVTRMAKEAEDTIKGRDPLPKGKAFLSKGKRRALLASLPGSLKAVRKHHKGPEGRAEKKRAKKLRLSVNPMNPTASRKLRKRATKNRIKANNRKNDFRAIYNFMHK